MAAPSTTSATVAHSHPIDNGKQHGSTLEVVGWILGASSGLIVTCRLLMKIYLVRTLRLDDTFIFFALILALGQTGTLSAAISNGFLAPDNSYDLSAQEKAIYAFNILFILSQAFAKLSIAIFVRFITPVRWHRQLCTSIVVGISVWALISVLVLAFQCQLPAPWEGSVQQCIDRRAASTFIGVVNIFLDALLIGVPAAVIWPIQQQIRRKIWVIVTFCVRICVIVATIAQLVVIHQSDAEGAANLFLTEKYPLTTQIVEYASLITACVPSLKPVIERLSSGMIASNDIARRGGMSASLSQHEPGASKSSRQVRRLYLGSGLNETTITSQTRKTSTDIEMKSVDGQSQKSTGKIIRQTLTFEIRGEEAPRSA